MKITIEHYNKTTSIDGIEDDSTLNEVLATFLKMLVADGYSSTRIDVLLNMFEEN